MFWASTTIKKKQKRKKRKLYFLGIEGQLENDRYNQPTQVAFRTGYSI